MTTPYSFAGQLHYPPDSGQPDADRAFSVSANFEAKSVKELVLTGAGTHVVDFGSIAPPGAQAVLLKHEAVVGGQPIQLLINGGTDLLEVAPGGFWAYSNPSPVAGLTALSIQHAGDARVKIWILG